MGFDNASGTKSQEIVAPIAGSESSTGVAGEVASQFSSCVERYEPRTPIQRVEDMLDKQLEITPIFPELLCPEPEGTNVRGAEEPGRVIPPNEQKESDPQGMQRKQDMPPDIQKRQGDYTPPPGQKPLPSDEKENMASEVVEASEQSLGTTE